MPSSSSSSSLPSDKKIQTFITELIHKDAAANGGQVTVSVRQVRAALAEHFDVEDEVLKGKKKDVIKRAAQDAVESIPTEDNDEEGAQASSSSSKSPTRSPPAADDAEFSELDDSDVDAKKVPTTKQKRKKGKSATSSSEAKKPRKSSSSSSTTNTTDDKGAEEVAKLKKFVVACGVRKQWKNFFASKDADGSTQQQAKALRALLAELGMEGRLSMEKAKKIKEKREFAEELRAIGADQPLASSEEEGKRGGRGRGGRVQRAGHKGAAAAAAAAVALDSDDDDDDDDISGGSEDRDEVQQPKKARFSSSLAAFAAELNSDEDD